VAVPPVAELTRQLRQERLLDMEARLARFRARAFVVLALALVASAPWMGAWTLVPMAITPVAFWAADRMVRRSRRPVLWAGAGWAVSPLVITLSAALTGAAESPALAWLALPIVTLGARFELRGVIAGVAYVVALMMAVTLGLDAGTVFERPEILIFPFALVVAMAILAAASTQSEREHRRGAIVDPLTGLLNRTALAQRFTELEAQAGHGAEGSIGFLVGDIDHFKAINDAHGHPVGDAVLTDVAYAMRKALRAFDLLYRVGGEEFVVLLPGADVAETRRIGERLRAAVAERPTQGVTVTISFGAAAVRGGVSFADVYGRADEALYRAKRAGRNRVELADPAPLALRELVPA
jgi:diguanylate cyclase (GGDEF)-like protein